MAVCDPLFAHLHSDPLTARSFWSLAVLRVLTGFSPASHATLLASDQKSSRRYIEPDAFS